MEENKAERKTVIEDLETLKNLEYTREQLKELPMKKLNDLWEKHFDCYDYEAEVKPIEVKSLDTENGLQDRIRGLINTGTIKRRVNEHGYLVVSEEDINKVRKIGRPVKEAADE